MSDGRRASLATPAAIPANTELVLLAGDLGASFNEELPKHSGAYEDRHSETRDPAISDEEHLRRWNRTFQVGEPVGNVGRSGSDQCSVLLAS